MLPFAMSGNDCSILFLLLVLGFAAMIANAFCLFAIVAVAFCRQHRQYCRLDHAPAAMLAILLVMGTATADVGIFGSDYLIARRVSEFRDLSRSGNSTKT